MILKRCKVQKTDIQGFQLSLLLTWLKSVESPLRPMYTGYLSILCTNYFRCVLRYYYGLNGNTDTYHKANNKDQTVQMRRLVCPFVVKSKFSPIKAHIYLFEEVK